MRNLNIWKVFAISELSSVFVMKWQAFDWEIFMRWMIFKMIDWLINWLVTLLFHRHRIKWNWTFETIKKSSSQFRVYLYLLQDCIMKFQIGKSSWNRIIWAFNLAWFAVALSPASPSQCFHISMIVKLKSAENTIKRLNWVPNRVLRSKTMRKSKTFLSLDHKYLHITWSTTSTFHCLLALQLLRLFSYHKNSSRSSPGSRSSHSLNRFSTNSRGLVEKISHGNSADNNRAYHVQRSLFTSDTRKKALLSPHTQFFVGGRKFAAKGKSPKKILVSVKKSRGAKQSGQFSVVRPHIRGEHGILMIAFGVNFRYELYRPRLLFSCAREGSERKIFSFSCVEGVNEKWFFERASRGVLRIYVLVRSSL